MPAMGELMGSCGISARLERRGDPRMVLQNRVLRSACVWVNGRGKLNTLNNLYTCTWPHIHTPTLTLIHTLTHSHGNLWSFPLSSAGTIIPLFLFFLSPPVSLSEKYLSKSELQNIYARLPLYLLFSLCPCHRPSRSHTRR